MSFQKEDSTSYNEIHTALLHTSSFCRTKALLFYVLLLETNTHLGMFDNRNYPIFGDEVVAFIVASTRYCLFLDQLDSSTSGKDFFPEVLSLLCQVYATALKLPPCEEEEAVFLERFVTEPSYEAIREKVKCVLGDADVYLDVALENARYLEMPVSVSMSESLADLYQVLGDCIGIFKTENELSIQASITEVLTLFKYEWGSSLLSAMRRLHELYYTEDNDVNYENNTPLYEY